jgi:hypothetical protein
LEDIQKLGIDRILVAISVATQRYQKNKNENKKHVLPVKEIAR